jgi:hypothetical protein
MSKLKATTFLLVIFALFAVTGQAALASASTDKSLFVVLVDRAALAGSQNNADLTESFVGLLSNLRDGQNVAFMTADNPTEILGPAPAGSPEFKNHYRAIVNSISTSDEAANADLVTALGHAFELFDFQRASGGSTLYLVTGGESEGAQGARSESLTVMVNKFKNRQWPIVGVGVPGSSELAQEFLGRASSESGGDLFMLSVPEGFKAVSNSILQKEAKGTLAELGQGAPASSDVLTSILDIAPGTLEATLIFFKHGPDGSLRLRNPSGLEASEGDRTLSSVIETPYIVMWKLVNPALGEWTVDISGTEGEVSTWHYTANRFSVNLITPDSIPFDQPVELSAYIADGQNKAMLEGVEVRARVTDPSGSTFVHRLNDEGRLGDSTGGDGFYSQTITPLGTEGSYSVALELYWPEYDHYITSQETLSARAFPTVDVEMLKTEGLKPGERVKVATAEVNIKGQAYTIPTNAFSVDVTSNLEEAGKLEVIPQRLVNAGQAWAFDIFYTPVKEDRHSLIFRLDMNYAGRKYSYHSDTFVMSSVLPEPPPEPAVVAAPEPPPALPPAPAPVPEQALPMGLLAIPAVAVAVLLIGFIYMMSKTRPYGYLYNDRGELLVDFSTLKRRAMAVLFSKNAVKGKELGLNELNGVSFNFAKGRVEVRSERTEPTVRINNQPLVAGDQTTLYDHSWIGTQGKLFSFLLSRHSIQPQPGVGDD